ncbi:AAA domain-containing protein [Ochromonadaceae sp. CCMP2298]|nr:AAA domain-containing protein [Ochromonadaceae sp. CCMP2298]
MPLPNVLLTGTPGTGKTETAKIAAERSGMKHVNVGDLIKQNECHEGKDDEYDTYIIDDDKVVDMLEPILEGGGCIVDFHSCELFPERWFELVLVLQTETEILYDRLTARGYGEKKRAENMECEIMQTVFEEARESYDANIVHALPSGTLEELESNVERICTWLGNWKENNPDA